MFRADGGIIEPRGNGMSALNLSEFILENVGLRSLQNTERTALETGRVFFRQNAFASRLDPKHSDILIGEERIEEADGIGTSTDTRHEEIRQSFFFLENLPSRFIANDPLKISNHHR